MIPTETGGAVDDAYLYRFVEDEYLLVVNAANREKDWDHLQAHLRGSEDVEISERLQGIVNGCQAQESELPDANRATSLGFAAVGAGSREMSGGWVEV